MAANYDPKTDACATASLDIEPRPRQGLVLTFIVIATIAAAVLRLLTVFHLSVYGDEVWTIKWSEKPISIIMSQAQTGLTMHLYILFMKLWIALFGESLLIMKLPSFVAGIALIPSIYAVGKRIVGREPALIASLLGVFNMMLIIFSRTARVYSILVLVTLWSFGLYLRTIREARGRDYIYLGLINAVILMLSIPAGCIVMVQAVSFLVHVLISPGRRWRRLICMAVSLAITGCMALGFYFGTLGAVLSLAGEWSGAKHINPSLVYNVLMCHQSKMLVMIVLFLAGLAAVCLPRYRSTSLMLVLWAILPVCCFVLMGVRQLEWTAARILIPTIPAQLMIISVGSWEIASRLLRRKYPTAALGLAALIAVSPPLVRTMNSHALWKEQSPTQATIDGIRSVIRPGDMLVAPEVLGLGLSRDLRERLTPLSSFFRNVAQPTIASKTGGRLIILTRPMPKAQDLWASCFVVHVISDPYCMEKNVLLVSPPIEAGNKALMDYCRTFCIGILNEDEETLDSIPAKRYELLRKVHAALSIIADGAGDQASVVKHRLASKLYIEKRDAARETIR